MPQYSEQDLANYATVRELRAALEAEITAQRTRCSFAEMNLERALTALIAVDPGPAELVAETRAALAHLSAVIAPIEVVGTVPVAR
jgi:hypothetical protein